MKIGIYCGSFSPVHKGHIKIVKEIIKQEIVDKVLIIPTGSYWDKNNLMPLEHRISMLKYYENKHIEVETKLNDVYPTYKLMEELEKRYPDDEFYLILGADNLLEFDKWVEYKKLLEYPFIIIKRNDLNEEKIDDIMKSFNKTNYVILNMDTIDISSTQINKQYRENKTFDSNYIDDFVSSYIIKNNLIK